MIAWFILAVATLALLGYVAVNNIAAMSAASDGFGRMETVRRVDEAVSALLARAASPDGDGIMYLPVGVQSTNGQGYNLPRDIGVQAQTPFGKKLVYCPFGDTGKSGTAHTVSSANGTSYSVATKTLDGKVFIVGGRPTTGIPALLANNDPNLLGFVMAPRSKLSAMPSCNQIIYQASTGKYEAPDAIVRPLTRNGGVDEARTVNSRQIVFYVSPSGTGRGASPGDPASLATAVNFYRSRLPAFMTINLSAGNYGIGPNDLFITGQTQTYRSNLTINGVAGTTMIDMTAAGGIQIPGDLVINGATFDQDTGVVVASGYQLTLNNAQVGYVATTGTVTMLGNTSLSPRTGTSAIQILNGGKVSVGGRLDVYSPAGNGIVVSGDGVFSGNGSQVVFSTASSARFAQGILLAGGGTVSFANSTISFPAGAVRAISGEGNVSLRGSNLTFGAYSDYAIMAGPGSRIMLQGSTVGSGGRSMYGVYDMGAVEVSGTGSTIYSSVGCWWGDQFAQSAAATSGASSVVLADQAVAALPASPTPAQIAAYADARAANAARAGLRASNRSAWICQA